MAGTTLKTYIQEIEKQIESERMEEAIAHCRYILRAYPKYVDVYRLLGKAFLESQRYGDAADILQRVLSSVPEDFVSHVGMSIIREDEGNLDEAIWHMERAFEVQPGNSAIQDELRRLYGRRDGAEPPKIRLTRGALARLYLKGNLYNQAIAETRVALAENPDRLDLQVLLATIYTKTGQRAEAAEAANAVLRKLPNCLAAIQILVGTLSNTERAEEAQSLSERLHQLDPYTAFINAQRPSVDQVPDNAVTIEKLEWRPGQVPIAGIEQPEWATSLGVKISGLTPSSQEQLPGWLNEEGAEAAASAVPAFSPEGLFEETPISAEPSAVEEPGIIAEEEFPDWMKAAGWVPTAGLAEEAEKSAAQGEGVPAAGEEEAELAKAEIPDWLRAMAPSEVQEAQLGEEEVSPWLDKLIPSEAAAETPGWPQEGEPSGEQLAGEEAGFEETPDWLTLGVAAAAVAIAGEGEETPPPAAEAEEGEIPDWLMEMGEAAPSETAVAESLAAEARTETPGWLQEIAEESLPGELEEPGQLPGWLPEEAPTLEAVEAEAVEEIPAWLLESEEIPPTAMTPEPLAAGAEEEIPDWLREVEAPLVSEAAGIEAVSEFETEGILDRLKEIEEAPVEMADTKPTRISIAEDPAGRRSN